MALHARLRPPLAFAPNWGEVTPFVLKRSSQFRPAATVPLGSKKYAADYNEIKLIGGDDINTPSTRTPDQTEIGLFWIESSPLAWNRLARAVSARRSRSVGERALVRAAESGDGGRLHRVVGSQVSLQVLAPDHRDPAGRHRRQSRDGRRLDWTPLQFTYPMPDHDSGHAVQGGVAAEILKQVFGTDDISFTACSTTVGPASTCEDPDPVIRSYSSFSEAADENSVSRIYIGIHFRRAVEEGVQHGRRIAAYAVRRFMKPAH